MPEPVASCGWGQERVGQSEALEPDALEPLVVVPFVVPWRECSDEALDPTPDQFDGIEVRRVRRQVEQGATRRFDQRCDGGAMVKAGIVQHQNTARR